MAYEVLVETLKARRSVPDRPQPASAGRKKGENMSMKKIKVSSTVGKEHGHVPGNNYHDVEAAITRSIVGRWAAKLLETWGSSQGCDEEHGRKEVAALGNSLVEVVREAERKAEAAGIDRSYAIQALSGAEQEAAEQEEQAEEAGGNADAMDLSSISTERLVAELRARGVTVA